MATRIELISATAEGVQAAFYYPVPAPMRLAAAADPNRVAAGTRLSAQELADLKSGVLYEFLFSLSVSGWAAASIRTLLEQNWTDKQSEAANEYTFRYRFKNVAWDGSSWS